MLISTIVSHRCVDSMHSDSEVHGLQTEDGMQTAAQKSDHGNHKEQFKSEQQPNRVDGYHATANGKGG